MGKRTLIAVGALAALSGCGLENLFGNATHDAFDRPASRISGATAWAEVDAGQIVAIDGQGNAIAPFAQRAPGASSYEIRLPSGRYSMIRVQARAGNMLLRSLVPFVGEESATTADLDARSVTEALIVEAWSSANAYPLNRITPDAYLGTRALIRAAFDAPGPTQELLGMVERIIARGDPLLSQIDPDFFNPPELTCAPPAGATTGCELGTYAVTASPLVQNFLERNLFDYTGDGAVDTTTTAFDAKLAEVAPLYRPQGCPDPTRIRTVFEADFREGSEDGLCRPADRFKWATDRPGKQMFFVGWIHEQSDVQDPAVGTLLGASTPNQVPMYDDGTNGDAVAGDGIWTVTFDLPVTPGQTLRLGYKYTWGTRGAPWTGSEEWPGNSRIIQIEDVNGDAFVYRRDVFGDEATNKDRSNASRLSSIGFGTVLRGCTWEGAPVPEAREQPFADGTMCVCGEWSTPESVGPINVACTE